MVGTSFIMGGLVCFFDLLTQRTKAASFTRTTYVTFCCGHVRMAQDDVKLLLFGLGYIFMIAVGVVIAYAYENLHDFSDALLFAVTNYTTSGLIRPRMSKGSLIATTVSLIFGIPLNALFWGDLATKYYASVQARQSQDEDELAADGDPSPDGSMPKKGPGSSGDYVSFLQRELVNSGLITARHLESIKSKYKTKVREQQADAA